MEFFAGNGTRPVRLCEQTRAYAWESLNHKYGQETWKNPGVEMGDVEGFAAWPPIRQYDAVIERIVRTAPIRICPEEKVSGSATFGLSMRHCVPATLNGEVLFSSISHLTIDFETVLKQGVQSLWQQAEEALERFRGTEREAFARSCVHSFRCMKLWHERYLEALAQRPGYEENIQNLQQVPFGPARSFHEAVQSIWFTFAFVRLCGNWPGIGRIDWLLGEYLERDLASGALTLDQAREILAHFFIKGCEWIRGGDHGGGDAQHYQNLLLGGVDESGREVSNAVTGLVLDIIEELGISDFPTTVRLNRHTAPELVSRVAEVMKLGGGVLAVYNEDLVLDSLIRAGYAPAEARKFANDGCWEVQIPGKTYFTYIPFDALQILQKKTLQNYSAGCSFPDFASLYARFVEDLRGEVEAIVAGILSGVEQTKEEALRWKPAEPCTVISLFEQGCIQKGLSYLEGGPVYHLASPHIGGLPDVANSLYAIQKLVYEEKQMTLPQLLEILRNNWEGNEALRQSVLRQYTYYGNDHDPVDTIAQWIIRDFAEICEEADKNGVYRIPAGVSTFGRQLEWSPYRFATPYGKRAHDILAANFSPTPGTDKEGATAIIRSYCKADLKRVPSGAALDLKLLPSAVKGENGVETIAALLRGFAALGGFFMQLDIADAALLREAQAHPEDYQNLSVRVSGWNARFVTLNKAWQDMVIAQTGSGV